jgi:Fungal potassium channel
MANNWYSINSYNHFCFFCQINNSKKKKDEFAFFIFFTFKGWKRLLVADGPRQTINALTLYNFARCKQFSTEFSVYTDGNIMTTALLLTMLFTVLVFAASLILLAIACLMYIPLVFYIRGNLKEYCCHKIDKRISELVQFKKKQRLAKQEAIMRREAAGDFSHLRNKKGEIVGAAIPQPTLPMLDIDVLKDDGKPRPPKVKRSSVGSSIAPGVRDDMLGFPAESPAFPPVTFHGAPAPGSSLGHYGDYDAPMYSADDNASNAHLMAFAGPAGGSTSSLHSASPDVYPVQVKGHGGLPGAGYGPSGWYADQPNQMHAQRSTPAQQNVMANAGLDYPPPPATNGVSGLDYPPPDISAYMPYSEEPFPPIQPGYMHHTQQGSFGGASSSHGHFEGVMQGSQAFAQEPHASRGAYDNTHVEEQGISRDESSGGFFEQLNRHHQGASHNDSGRQQPRGQANGSQYPAEHYQLTAQQPYQAGSRVQSVNFEDIYAHYEER